ncbi:MAG: hypothetical protein ACI9VM_000877 [Candidatus Azotimanducaceae bacterium]|jgi:hypothetical protein
MRLVSAILFFILFWGIFHFQREPAESQVTFSDSFGDIVKKADVQVAAIAMSEQEPERVLFVGDIMLSRNVEKIVKKYTSDYPYQHLRSVFDQHTYQVGNFEGSIPKVHVPTQPMKFQFSVDPTLLLGLKHASFTHASLANNHSFDYGKSGYSNTRSILFESGIDTFGRAYSLATSSMTDLALPNQNIGLLGIDLVLSTPNDEELTSIFKMATEKYNFLIVYTHWGVEYELSHSKQQERLAKKFIELGADLIIGHHPHVVQDIQVYDGVLVFYSLGNFIFDQYFSEDVQTGLTLSATFDDELVVTLLPITTMESKIAPRLMNPLEKDTFLRGLAERSDPELSTDILSGEIAF